MNKYEIRTQKKKDAVIQAALELFKENGYTNVGINDIASKSGVSSVSIYNYFDSKNGLVMACTRKLMSKSTEEINQLLHENADFKEKLLRAVTLCENEPFKLVKEYFSPEALSDKTFMKLFWESTNEIRMDVLRVFIESGKQDESIDPSISTDTIMDFLGAVARVQSEWKTTTQLEKSSELYKLMLYGLIGRKES